MTSTPDNLPARTADFAATGTPMSQTATSALAFALGYTCARPQSADAFGPFCAVVEALMARRSDVPTPGPIGGYDQRTEFGVIMGLLPTDLARSVAMLYQVQRGQRWARTGQYRSPSGNSGVEA